MTDFKESVRALLRKLRRGSTATRNARQLLRGFDAFGIDLVFDVGANTGQFAREIRDNGFRGRIVSFEPLSLAHRELTAAAASDPLWSVHERCALGDKEGSAVLNIAGNSVSSSVLEMAAAHEDAAPGSKYVGREETALATLDSVADRYLGSSERPFLKIDTQGFEWQVLTGAEKTLPSIRGVLCELSLVTLYEGQHLWRDVVDRLEESGFTLWGVQPSFMDQRGRNLQADAIFFRER
jgi:FkbM family methyltransferase